MLTVQSAAPVTLIPTIGVIDTGDHIFFPELYIDRSDTSSGKSATLVVDGPPVAYT
jgi:hypothetical protein